MQSRIRVIKRGASAHTNEFSATETEKTVQEREREMANTVKSWVAEWEARNRVLNTAAASLMRSLEDSRSGQAPQFGFNHS